MLLYGNASERVTIHINFYILKIVANVSAVKIAQKFLSV